MFFLKVTIKGVCYKAQRPQVTTAAEEAGLCLKMKQKLMAGIAGLHMKSEQHCKEICSPRLWDISDSFIKEKREKKKEISHWVLSVSNFALDLWLYFSKEGNNSVTYDAIFYMCKYAYS